MGGVDINLWEGRSAMQVTKANTQTGTPLCKWRRQIRKPERR